jgi:(S)-mandelate dehydrogenase
LRASDQHWQMQSVEGIRQLARQRLPRFVFDFIDGGAGMENTLRENRAALDRVRLLGSAPTNMSGCVSDTELFGKPASLPLIIGPTGLAGAARPRGDLALAQAAATAGIPFVMSSAATVAMEDLAAIQGRRWFQLYVFRDRAVSSRLIDRAAALGFEALEVTVDNAIPGRRLRDARNGFTLPFRWSAKTVWEAATHPAWAVNMARAGPPRLEVMQRELRLEASTTIAELMQAQLDPAVDWNTLKWVRDQWKGPLIVKGLLDPTMVEEAISIGVDGIVVSNHGGRQLDGAVATIDILPEFVAASAGKLTILVDSGFRTGSDVARALALGANAVQLGRATLFGLAAAGETGVLQVLNVLKEELHVAQMLMAARSPKDFGPHMVRTGRGPDRPVRQRPEPLRPVPDCLLTGS